ncbi:MAG TPA: SDR family oxidoreductase [Gemmataceae bacterium]|nr:SDR family oxidoreductase [Gemmataceae bacterium]
MDLIGKVAIVTGAGGAGCGRADARRLAREGAAIIVSDIDEAGGRKTVGNIEAAGGRAAFFRADAGVEADVAALIDFAEKTFGGVDVIVNNASAPYHADEPMGHWVKTVQVDLLGPMFAVLHGIEALRRRGGGAIVNVGSTSALGHGRKHGHVPAYDAAKAGVIRLTTTLGWLGQRDNIRVNCLVPGWIATPEVKAYYDSLSSVQRRELDVPQTLLSLDDIADAVFQLATDETLAGRIMVWWNGQPRRLIPAGDPGYAALE